jgi:TonB-linked SusC/RagA family outer membrane protein
MIPIHHTLFNSFIYIVAGLFMANNYANGNIALPPLTAFSSDTLQAASDKPGNLLLLPASSVISSVQVTKNALIKVEDAFNGTLPGVFSIRKASPSYGLSQLNFYVRGKATLADNTPLVYVDGVLSNINLIHPNEIEEIAVIKDPVELAAFGQRSANGIIHLKTKKGVKARNFMQVEMNAGVQLPEYIAPKLNAFQYSVVHNEANINDGTSPIFDPSKHDGQSDSYLYPSTDFMNDFLSKTGQLTQFNFTAGGGNEVARYFTILGYTRQDGLFALPSNEDNLNPAYNERYNFRTNLDVNLGAGFYLQSNVSAVYDDRRSPWIASDQTVNSSANYIMNVLYSTPANAFPLVNPNGTLGGTSVYRNNPIGLLSSGQRTENTRLLMANIQLSKDLSALLKGLKADVRYAFENYNSYYKGNYTVFGVSQYNEDGSYSEYGANDTKVSTVGGQLSDYYSDINVEAALRYKTRIGNADIDFSTSINDYQSYVAGDEPPYRWLANSNHLKIKIDNTYIAQLAATYQGSNSYARGQRYGFFPAGSFAWILSNSDILKSTDLLNYLSAKVSAGLLGNDRTGGERFMYRQAFYNTNGYSFGIPNGSAQGSYEGTLPNPDASWEKSLQYVLNIDAVMFDNQLTMNASVFHENRFDILVSQSNVISSVVGNQLPQLNAGIINNSGVELAAAYRTTIGEVQLIAAGHFTYAKNKIVDLKELNYPANESYRYRKNQSVDALFGFIADGIYQSEQEIQESNVLSSFGPLQPGDLKYRDLNNDGIINTADKSPIGNLFPNVMYGLSTGVDYKNFDFYFHVEGSADFYTHLIPTMFSAYAFENRYNTEQPAGTYPRLSFVSTHTMQASDYWLEKAHLIRLSNVELGYTFPERVTRTLKLGGLRMYVRGNELLATRTQRENRDIESSYAGSTQYPFLKTALLGLKITL